MVLAEDIIFAVRDLLDNDKGNLNFSPAARYAVQRLADYAAQEHELREKAEVRCDKLQQQVLGANRKAASAAHTNNDLQQQLSFMQQALKELQHAGV